MVYPLQGGKVDPNFENQKKFFSGKKFFSLDYDHKNMLNPLVKSVFKSVHNITGDICNFVTAVSALSNRSLRSVYNYARRPILRTGLCPGQLFLVVKFLRVTEWYLKILLCGPKKSPKMGVLSWISFRGHLTKCSSCIFGRLYWCYPTDDEPRMCLSLVSIYRHHMFSSCWHQEWLKLLKWGPKYVFGEKCFLNRKISKFCYKTIHAHRDSCFRAKFCGNRLSGSDQTGAC